MATGATDQISDSSGVRADQSLDRTVQSSVNVIVARASYCVLACLCFPVIAVQAFNVMDAHTRRQKLCSTPSLEDSVSRDPHFM